MRTGSTKRSRPSKPSKDPSGPRDIVQALPERAAAHAHPRRSRKASPNPDPQNSRFDIDKNQEEIVALQEALNSRQKDLKNVKKYTIAYLRKLIEKYGKPTPAKPASRRSKRSTGARSRPNRSKWAMIRRADLSGPKFPGLFSFTCTNFDKLLVFFKDGTYKVTNIPEKQYVENAAWVSVADKTTIMNVA